MMKWQSLAFVFLPFIAVAFAGDGVVPVYSPSTTQSKSSLSYGSNGGIAFSGTGGTPSYNSCYWNDTDSCSTVNVRARERLLLGNAVLATDNRNGNSVWNSTWMGSLPAAAQGTNWLVRDPQFVVMTDRGAIAVSGMSQSSQGDSLGAGKPAPIGVSGYVYNDTAIANANSWGAYFEGIHNPNGVSTLTFGVEIDTRNMSTTNTAGNPYSVGQGDIGAWIGAGAGEGSGSGAPNPSVAAIVTTANSQTFNTGLIMKDGSLTKDGNGNSQAISLGHGAGINWYTNSSTISATIDDNHINLPLTTPASSSSSCTVGTMNWDASFIYVCTAANSWKRAALSTF